MSEASYKGCVIYNFGGSRLEKDVGLIIEVRVAHFKHLIESEARPIHHVLRSVGSPIRRDHIRFHSTYAATRVSPAILITGRWIIRLYLIYSKSGLCNT